ncbi:MAG: RelA/SpoT family protein [Candidatus Pacebacteria bacterium]|nr:RelA/SpoT family protein [Candidatus Paceibacterota bacterium]
MANNLHKPFEDTLARHSMDGDSYPSVDDILKHMKSSSKNSRMLVAKAYAYAEKAHEGQVRYSGGPYFAHAAFAAQSLAIIQMDATTIAAGLLHDTIEDGKVPAKTIEKEFGKTICFLIEGVTKLGKLKYRGAERHVESLRKFFIAMSEDIRVLLIKLADRLHNIQTLEHVPEEKRKRIAIETLEIYARLADRLGMGKWRGVFEDAAFPYAYPEDYEKVVTTIKSIRVADEEYAKKIHRSIQKELAKSGIQDAKVDYRVKSLFSLWRKLQRKDMDPEKVFDILAVRVIVKSVEECYRALGIIHKHWRPVPGRIKDYIAIPKPNGYQSLHTTIFRGDGGIIEIQIRTEEMHLEALYGIAAHLAYKESKNKTIGPGSDISWVQDLVKFQKEAENTDVFLKNLKMDFFRHRVFVFTPQGDVLDLPEESSPIDFAYAIHSDIGDHVSGAKINGKLVSLDTKLKNSDIVEIETKDSASPGPKWLDYAKTTMAKRHINAYLEKSSPIESLAKRFFGKKK